MGMGVAASYDEVIAAVVDAREAPATERFDAVLAAAVESGAIDPALARTLRWWQREAVRELAAHVKDVLPRVLVALDESARSAGEALAAAEVAWQAAGGEEPAAAVAPQSITLIEPAGQPSEKSSDDSGNPAGAAADITLESATEPVAGPSIADPLARRRLVVAGLTTSG